MQVQVNPQTAARNIAEFIKSHGGESRHMEVLELMARVCGFTTYQALKAAEQSQAKTKSQAPATAKAVKGAFQLEDPQRVVHQQSLVEWNEEGERVPGPEFDLVVEGFPGCLRVMVKQKGVDNRSWSGTPMLDALVEIKNGVPCAHLTNDADALLVSAFAGATGMYFRPEDGDLVKAQDASGSLGALVAAACETPKGFVVKHGEAPVASACDACGAAVQSLRGHPEVMHCNACKAVQDKSPDKTVAELGLAEAASVLKVTRQCVTPNDNLMGRDINVELFIGQSTWRDFLYIQVSECKVSGVGADRIVEFEADITGGHSCFTAVPTSTPVDIVRQFAQDVCQVATYFRSRGWSPAYIKEVLWLMVEDEPLQYAKKVRAMTETHRDRDACYAAMVKEFGIAKDPNTVQ